MAGAHLDSVPEGPGINDNGSGSSALLEVAEQLAKANKVANKLRFAWWGGEEAGLVGSTFYVNDLAANNEEELNNLGMYLNFDMVASPNYGLFIYDGDGSDFPALLPYPTGPTRSSRLRAVLRRPGHPLARPTEFSGRSDYQAFINNGVPAGGLFTGAEQPKTPDAGSPVGRHRGCRVRPLLPPGLRHHRQPQHGGAGDQR